MGTISRCSRPWMPCRSTVRLWVVHSWTRCQGSRYANMKELRPRGGSLRLLFAFDTERQGIVLVAGDKTNNWNRWYRVNIPIADDRLQEHLESLLSKTRKGRGR